MPNCTIIFMVCSSDTCIAYKALKNKVTKNLVHILDYHITGSTMTRFPLILCRLLCVFALAPLTVTHALKSLTLSTTYQDSYPKYYTQDEGGTYEGICIEIYKALDEKLLDINFNVISGMASMKRIDTMLNNEEIDFFIGMASNKKREENFHFIPIPLYDVNHVIAQHVDDTKRFTSFSDISATENAVVLTNKGSGTARLLKAQKGLTIDDGARTLDANVRKLAYKRGRVLYFHDLGLYLTIKKSEFSNRVRVSPHSFKNYQHFLVVRKSLPVDAIERITMAVSELKSEGTLDIIAKKYFSL